VHAPACDESQLWLVIDAAREFDRWGGVSVGLVAWEYDLSEESIADAFAAAIDEGLLVRAGVEETSDEELWRLAGPGWSLCARAPGARVPAVDGAVAGS
jgi:hypothetical protein